jgi:HPt (histidine-containing phosphotransfer) domain-containing protein
VDVQQGLARWGDVLPYHQALRRFAQEQAIWLDAAEHQQAPDTIAQAQATAHRLQGAAANLGLVALVQAARRVERGNADTPSTQRGQAWRQLRQVLHDTLAAVQDTMPPALHTPAAASGDATPSDPGQPAPADTALVQLWTHQAQRLRQAFHRGECLEPLFAQFCASVRPHATGPALRTLQALEQASEDFDFEGAVAALDRLQSHLTPSRSEDAVL